MRYLPLLPAALLLFLTMPVYAEWAPVSAGSPQEGRVVVEADAGTRTVLSLEFPGYEVEEVEAGGMRCARV
ncbi:MAG: hypothetical protein MUE60_13880, partial [Candidatus Eisenbacteria bacterium]|nr:hypothetical protein [Candidatus Eisenbacteria bacterium]